MQIHRILRSAPAAIAVALALCGAGSAAQAPAAKPDAAATQKTTAAPALKSLQGFGDLQAAFRKDDGQVRLVLLLSPT